MSLGRSIRIYLSDGSVAGIRHGEIVKWTGQAISCPRARFPELRDWPKAKKPGVYFLFGTDDETGQEAVQMARAARRRTIKAKTALFKSCSHDRKSNFWSNVLSPRRHGLCCRAGQKA